jgi:outer membrane protein
MNLALRTVMALTAAAPWLAQGAATLKPASINVQAAILTTKEGQKATQDLQAKFGPRKQALEKQQSDLAALQARMRAGSATMGAPAKDKLIADIDARTKDWNRDSQDFNSEVQQEQGRIMNEVGQKMLDVIEKYGLQHGILLVADVSNQQSPVLWTDPSLDITTEVIKLYDQTYPLPAAPAATPPPAKKQ